METVSIGSITLVDWNDISIASSAPAGPVLSQLWFDSSIAPPALKQWNGSQWISANVTPQEYTDLLATVQGTSNYRDTRPPTNSPSFGNMAASAIYTTPADGSIAAKLPIIYSQPASGLPADFILVYMKEGGGAITPADVCFTTNASSGFFEIKVKPSTVYSFGLQAVRNTSNSMLSTAMVTSANVASPTGNYLGSINGLSATTLLTNLNSALKSKTNPFFEDSTVGASQVPALWNGFTVANTTITTNGLIGGKAVQIAGSAEIKTTELLSVDTNREYKLRVRIRQLGKVGTPTFYAGIACYAPDGVTLLSPANGATYHYSLTAGYSMIQNSPWVVLEARMTGAETAFTTYNKFKTGTSYVKPVMLINYGSVSLSDVCEIDSFEFFDITESNWKNLPDRPTDAELLNSQQKWADVSGTGRPSDYATKNMSWSQGTAPTSGMQSGDTWVCTSAASGDPNTGKLFTYNGVSWVPAADTTQVIINKGIASAGRFEVGNAAFGICNAGINGAVTGSPNTDIRFWAGSTFDNIANAKFKVQNDGTVIATGANISGSLVITAGPTYNQINQIQSSIKTISLDGDIELFKFSKDTSGSRGSSSSSSLSVFSRVKSASPFGESCILVEETTQNLISPVDTTFAGGGWYPYNGANITLTQNITVPEWDTTTATRIQSTVGTSNLKYYWDGLASVAAQPYSTTIYIKNQSPSAAFINNNLGTNVTLNPGEIKKFSATNPGNGSTFYQIAFYSATAATPLDIVVYQPQIEAKPYPTSFINGTRQYGKLVIPGLEKKINFNKFGVLGWIKRTALSGMYGMIFGVWGPFYFSLDPTNALVVSWMDAVPAQRLIASSLLVSDLQWHLVGMSYDTANGNVDFFLDGAFERKNPSYMGIVSGAEATFSTFGELNYTGTQYALNGYMSNFVVKTNDIFTQDEVSSYYAINSPFVDTMATTSVPTPTIVSAPTYS